MRQAILDAATAEFSAHGLGGARIDQIALRSGSNKRLIYYYFGNKDDLFLAVVGAVVGEFVGSNSGIGYLSPNECE